MDSAKPPFLYERILRDLEERIVSGQWPPGHPVPFEVDLAKAYNCSRMTVSKALAQLVRDGLIERRRRAGSRVAQPRAESAVMDICTVESEVRAMGQTYDYRLLQHAKARARADDPLFVPGTPLLTLHCLHLAAEHPFCLEQRHINLAIVPEAAQLDFAASPPGNWLQQQVPWNAATHTIRAVAATAKTADVLHLEKGAPCLLFERETATPDGIVITFASFTYPGHRHAVRARLRG